ncbi:hypothetical protein HYZ99_05335 [Candidatus Peregrinibacteria bacterium]|nr:hypothetical protein [Candidatus Peregrinibacteria bacterium]
MKRPLLLVLFGLAFGFVEAVVVLYLRSWFGMDTMDPPQAIVLLNLGVIAFLSPSTVILPNATVATVEMVREAATIIMLVTVAALASNSFRQWIGAFLVAFAVWDLGYYFFLWILLGWPKSVLDPDIFFLLPVPWAGPVITPLVLSTALLLLGFWLFAKEPQGANH